MAMSCQCHLNANASQWERHGIAMALPWHRHGLALASRWIAYGRALGQLRHEALLGNAG